MLPVFGIGMALDGRLQAVFDVRLQAVFGVRLLAVLNVRLQAVRGFLQPAVHEFNDDHFHTFVRAFGTEILILKRDRALYRTWKRSTPIGKFLLKWVMK